MSNTQTNVKRVIQIKPIQRPINEEEAIAESHVLQLQVQKEIEIAKEELDSLKKQQETLLQHTENEIKLAKENWEEEKLHLMQEAKEAGFQAGFEQGKAESVSQFKELIEQANSIIAASKKDYQVTVDKSEETILLLAVQVAEKIVKQSLNEQPESFIPIIKDAILSIKDQSELTIYLHPDNYMVVVEQKSELERVLDSKAELSIYMNDNLEVGSCVIEHPFGKIDASIDTQLGEIKKVLHEIVMEQKE